MLVAGKFAFQATNHSPLTVKFRQRRIYFTFSKRKTGFAEILFGVWVKVYRFFNYYYYYFNNWF